MKKLRAVISRIVAMAVVAMAVVLATSSAALAQEFQKVDETKKLADTVPAVPFVGIAYGVIWLAVLIYVASVARGLARVNSEMDELRKKLDAAGGDAQVIAALALGVPSSAHFIFIPTVLILGIVLGFIMGSKATRDAFALEEKKAAERAERAAKRAARNADAGASSDTK